jgi:hypothetical protein
MAIFDSFLESHDAGVSKAFCMLVYCIVPLYPSSQIAPFLSGILLLSLGSLPFYTFGCHFGPRRKWTIDPNKLIFMDQNLELVSEPSFVVLLQVPLSAWLSLRLIKCDGEWHYGSRWKLEVEG